MKNLEQHFSQDLMTTQSSKSVIDSIPVDLLMDIFSRVPANSIARFRCLSKFWKSILGSPYFSKLFTNKSVARPRLFFTLDVNEELFFFSSPQPQNPDEDSSLVATPYMTFPKAFPTIICSPLYGLVFLRDWVSKALVVCNPVTRESITLPQVKGKGIRQSHFGFDPINKQFKVLFRLFMNYETPNTNLVLTLEAGKLLWRPIQDQLLPHYSLGYGEICINGILYYQVSFATYFKIVCFDFRSERYGLINMDNDMLHHHRLTLFNYKGHLGAHQHKNKFVLWVLEDAGKHKWSKRVCVLSPSGDEIVNKNVLVGMNGTGELVFSPCYLSNPFHIFYYSIVRNTFTRFKIKGFEKLKDQHISVKTFQDYVETIKFM